MAIIASVALRSASESLTPAAQGGPQAAPIIRPVGRPSPETTVPEAAGAPPLVAEPEQPIEPKPAGPLGLWRFLIRNRMVTWKYGRLLLRYLRRRLLTSAGRRWRTDGPLFLGKRLEIQIGKRGRIEFGRFVWIGDGTKVRCHEGEVVIGPKTVLGQECTISAYQRVRIGEQCVIADRAMFIDFDHGVVEVERPIRQQGIYKRDVEVGSNCWIGYGACILRGVRVGDNSIVGANAVVTRDVPANAVVGGVPARVIRMRDAPATLRWGDPVEP
jgi:acetyltransferase-like isoleucine patch superfamily enzyme